MKMKKIIIVVMLLHANVHAYTQSYVYKNYILTKKYTCSADSNQYFDFRSNAIMKESCIFYSSESNWYKNFFKSIPKILDESTNVHYFDNFCFMRINLIKQAKDLSLRDPQSYLNVVEIFYETQERVDNLFTRLTQLSEVDYPVVPVDWSFYLTSNKSIIVIFSEGYREKSIFWQSIDKILYKNSSVRNRKIVISNALPLPEDDGD